MNCHVATEAEPILSHLFGAEFGLEILLETGRLSSQLFSDWLRGMSEVDDRL